MMSKCNGDCGHKVGCAFAAQYRAGTADVVLCETCWDKGFRMWVNDEGGYSVGVECPQGYHEAILFWDEGGYVTGRGRNDMTYPDVKQPPSNREELKNAVATSISDIVVPE